jgi:Dyp-type peroxidase family
MTHQLQKGLVFHSGSRPPLSYRLLLLDIVPGTAREDIVNGLEQLVSMLAGLARGQVGELAGQSDDQAKATCRQFRSLRVLLGYGRRLFDENAHAPTLTTARRPDHLSYLPRQAEDPFPFLPWASESTRNAGEADIALQLLGESAATVNCGAVECWKLLEDEGLPLEVVASFSGFGRPDGRGWLEFHDGVSNIESSQRLRALEARADPAWMEGGTYMAFLRVAINLREWRRLDRSQQELVVGRDKLSGAALVRVDRDSAGRAVPVPAPAPGAGASKEELADWRDPPQTTDPLLELSHIHRANQNRASPAAPGGHRLFRQGYDFLDGFHEGTPMLGLNFVSFQSDLRSLQHVLHLPGWLGDVNFGGPAAADEGDSPSPRMLELIAGGLYAVPPLATPFPGHRLFGA